MPVKDQCGINEAALKRIPTHSDAFRPIAADHAGCPTTGSEIDAARGSIKNDA
jgi:hypothetical protein